MTSDSVPVLRCDSISKSYEGPGGVVHAVVDTSLQISRAATLALVGESGSGKTTVARLVLRLEQPDAGTVWLNGRDVHAASRRGLRDLRRDMQVVLQDPVASLNRRKTVGDIVALPLAVHKVGSRKLRRQRVTELLELVGLDRSYALRFPDALSGGQCQRVGIARALALDPSLLVLDEAVSSLDVSIRGQILNLLRELQGRLGTAHLFIAHDLAIVRAIATHVAVMYRGRIVEQAPRDAFFAAPTHPYSHELIAAVPSLRRGGRPHATVAVDERVTHAEPSQLTGDGCPFLARCPIGRERPRCASQTPAFVAIGPDHLVRCHYPDEGHAVGVTVRASARAAADIFALQPGS